MYWLILFRPYSPSRLSAWSWGTTLVISCMMIDALMYGFTPSPTIENLASPPPENRSSRPSSELPLKKVDSAAGFAPGTGTWARNRKTMRIPATNRSRRRISGARKALRRFSITVRRLRRPRVRPRWRSRRARRSRRRPASRSAAGCRDRGGRHGSASATTGSATSLALGRLAGGGLGLGGGLGRLGGGRVGGDAAPARERPTARSGSRGPGRSRRLPRSSSGRSC